MSNTKRMNFIAKLQKNTKAVPLPTDRGNPASRAEYRKAIREASKLARREAYPRTPLIFYELEEDQTPGNSPDTPPGQQ